MKQVLILNITRMGDLIQMIPLLARLDEESPGVKIDLIVDKAFAHVATLLPGIRHVLAFDFQQLMDDSRVCARDVVTLYHDLAHWAKPLLQVGYDRVVNLTFNRRSAFLVKYFGCADERGMTTADDGSFLVKNSWMKYFLDLHAYRQMNRFNIVDLYSLGGSGPGRFHPIRLTVPNAQKEWAKGFLRHSGTPKVWVAVQVGASDPMKAWRPEYFGQVMAHLSKGRDIGFVLIGTKKEEPAVKEAVQSYQQAGGRGILCEAVGKTSILELIALLQECQLMVTNDTGPMHMAVGVGTPVLNVSVGHVDFWETGPYGPGHWVVQPAIVCGPCGFDKVCPHHACKDQIIPQEMSELCLHILEGRAWPYFASKIRIYEGAIDEDQLGSFVLRAGYAPNITNWYGTYWRRNWYENFTGLKSHIPDIESSSPYAHEDLRLWEEIAPRVDMLCKETEKMIHLCQQRPAPVVQLKDAQHFIKCESLALKDLTRLSLTFGPLVGACIRETFNLEGQTLHSMVEENSRAFRELRSRARKTFEHLIQNSPQPVRRDLYVSAIG